MGDLSFERSNYNVQQCFRRRNLPAKEPHECAMVSSASRYLWFYMNRLFSSSTNTCYWLCTLLMQEMALGVTYARMTILLTTAIDGI
jgi:hypothetical protein